MSFVGARGFFVRYLQIRNIFAKSAVVEEINVNIKENPSLFPYNILRVISRTRQTYIDAYVVHTSTYTQTHALSHTQFCSNTQSYLQFIYINTRELRMHTQRKIQIKEKYIEAK